MNLRNITGKMVVARCSGTAAPHMSLIEHDTACPPRRSGKCGRQCGYSPADNGNVCFISLSCRYHDCLPCPDGASMCSSINDRGRRRRIAPLGQSSRQASQCQHSSGNTTRGTRSAARSKRNICELQIAAQVPQPVHLEASLTGGMRTPYVENSNMVA